MDAGQPANGLFDFRFALFSTDIGGVPVGAVQADDTLVSDGLFTVELDCGADAFDNTERRLEIVIGQIPLSPRQSLTRAPYAIQTVPPICGNFVVSLARLTLQRYGLVYQITRKD